MLDVAITGGFVVDGTAAPGVVADVGISGGRIVEIAAPGKLSDSAAETVAADGLVVSPGFVDVHTHLDAQVFWDPGLTPSTQHGMTTVLAGNCGFSIAPMGPEHGEYLMRMLARVEGIPLATLESGVPWSWDSMASYLSAVEQMQPALNMGFMAGHSAIRRTVMGEAAVGEKATADQVAGMTALLRRSVAEGALGFSSSGTASHADGDGNPVPSRAASRDELLAMCRVLRDFDGTQVEYIPCGFPDFNDGHFELMTDMALAAQRSLNWNVLLVMSKEATDHRLAGADYGAARGAHIVALAYPGLIRARYGFTSTSFDSVPHWAEVMALPAEAKKRAFADPAVRARLQAGLDSPEGQRREIALLEHHTLLEGFAPEVQAHVGRKLGDVARDLGKTPLDVLLDFALADDLRTGLAPRPVGDFPELWSVREALWSDPRIMLGASDAGAHLDMLSTFDFAPAFLQLVRERQTMPLEAAVARLTDAPARLYGLKGRGRLSVGWQADVVVFDPATIGGGPLNWRVDLPAGGGRLYSEPPGIHNVFVNGVEVARAGVLTGRRAGKVLRSGIDTISGG